MTNPTSSSLTENPTTSQAERRLSRNYDRAAWFYEVVAAVFSGGQIRASKKYSVAQLKPGERVIFIGVGTGEEAIMAAERGARVTCLDISRQMLARLERKLAARGLQAEIICQDALQHDRLAFYDAVACNYFLNVFRRDDMIRMLQHAAQLVRPGGTFLVADVAQPQGNWASRIFNRVYLKSAMTTFWSLGLVPMHPNYDYTCHFSDGNLEVDHIRHFRLFKGGPVVFQTIVGRRRTAA